MGIICSETFCFKPKERGGEILLIIYVISLSLEKEPCIWSFLPYIPYYAKLFLCLPSKCYITYIKTKMSRRKLFLLVHFSFFMTRPNFEYEYWTTVNCKKDSCEKYVRSRNMKKLEQQQRAQLTTLRYSKPILQVHLQVILLDSDQPLLKATNGTIDELPSLTTCFKDPTHIV